MMCELLAMSSGIAATVNLTLNVLARHGGGDGPDKDGWGIAYYEGGDVRLIKDAAPAFDSPWIGFVEGLSLRSTLVLAHIRRATSGDVALRNTHPFMRELGGRPHVFAHNGSVPGVFDSEIFRLGRFRPLGETDSERVFCVLMDRTAQAWERQGGMPTIEERTRTVADFAEQLRREGPANFLYADGDAVFLHGDRRKEHAEAPPEWPGLHFLVQHNYDGKPFSGAVGVKVEDLDHPVLLAASVPLTNEGWTPLAEGELLVARDGRILARIHT
jgi:predicted glutamine amidotransferase